MESIESGRVITQWKKSTTFADNYLWASYLHFNGMFSPKPSENCLKDTFIARSHLCMMFMLLVMSSWRATQGSPNHQRLKMRRRDGKNSKQNDGTTNTKCWLNCRRTVKVNLHLLRICCRGTPSNPLSDSLFFGLLNVVCRKVGIMDLAIVPCDVCPDCSEVEKTGMTEMPILSTGTSQACVTSQGHVICLRKIVSLKYSVLLEAARSCSQMIQTKQFV